MTVTASPRRLTLDGLFRPSSIAVIGASPSNSFGGRALRYLRRSSFSGQLYAVNPKYDEIDGVPCHPDVASLAEVEYAIVAVAQPLVLDVIRALGTKGCRTAVVLTSGFGEAGAAGRADEQILVDTARALGIRLVGPNCNGIINVLDDIPLGCSTAMERQIPAGEVAVIAQSGSLGASIVDLVSGAGLGISRVVAIGNGSDISIGEYLSLLADDPATSTVAVFVEGVAPGDGLIDALHTLRERGKRVAILKVGRSASGQEMAASHTASLAGSWTIFQSFAQAAGAIVVETLEQLIDTLVLLSMVRGPVERVQVLSLSGALCGIIADELDLHDLDQADLRPATVRQLATSHGLHPPINPLDFGKAPVRESDWSSFERVVSLLMQDEAVGFLLVGLGIAHVLDEVAYSVVAAVQGDSRTPVAVYLVGDEVTASAAAILRQGGVPLIRDLRRFLTSAAHIRDSSLLVRPRGRVHARADPTHAALLERALAQPNEYQVSRWLEAEGVPFPASRLCTGPQDLTQAASELAFPLVMKVVVDAPIHKTDHGLVVTGIRDEGAIARAFETIRDRAEAAGVWQGQVLVAEQVDVAGGAEVLVGVERDPVFGYSMVFAAGGIWTELLRDAVTVPLPESESDVLGALLRLRSFAVLSGARGLPLDVDALVRASLRLANAVRAAAGAIDSLECNPFVVLPGARGCFALDARVVCG